MAKIIVLETRRGSKVSFNFDREEVFKILLRDLDFAYIKFNTKELFLEKVNHNYQIVKFQRLKDKFTEYLRNDFEFNDLPKEINRKDLMNKYIEKKPITKSYARGFFKRETNLEENDFILIDDVLLLKEL